MTEMTNARPIRAISFGGPVQNGYGVGFTMTFQDGSKENYYCRADQLPTIMGSLHSFGTLAEKVRGGVKKGDKVLSTPYQVTQVLNGGHSDDGQTIVVQITTIQGFPLELAMTPDLARKTIEFLQREIAAEVKQGPNKGLN